MTATEAPPETTQAQPAPAGRSANVTVSVIIPAYNAVASLAQTVETALAQTVQPLEIIVVDDGSSDDTAELAGRFGGIVRVLRKPNGGPASARNLGVQHSQGEWIAFLDADDQWSPTKLERQIEHVGPRDVGLVHTLVTFQTPEPPPELGFEDMWQRNWIVNSAVMVRRATFLQLGGFNEDRALISVEDYNLWVRLAAAKWRIVLCPETLTHYTRGVGISSDGPRFFKASLYNIADLGRVLHLPKPFVDAKLAAIHLEFARGALYRRDMATARHRLLQAFRLKPSLRSLLLLGIACSPAELLNLRRHAVRIANRRRGLADRDISADLGPIEKHAADVLGQDGTTADVALFKELAILAVRNDLAAAHSQGDILQTVQRLGWLGYAAPATFRRRLRLADAQPDAGMAAGQSYLALTATLMRKMAPPRPASLGIDALEAAFDLSGLPIVAAARGSADKRACIAYYLAYAIHRRATASRTSPAEAAAATRDLLRAICIDVRHALADLRTDFGDADALYLWRLAEEVSARSRHLWFEALLLAEQMGDRPADLPLTDRALVQRPA